MASLDHQTAEDNAVQVMVNYENRNYLLCTLKRNLAWQVPLDLNFEKGTKISFICNGHGHIHLTGYTLPINELSFDDMDEEDEDQEEEEEEEEEVPQLVSKQSKRKAVNALKDEKKIKRVKQVETESSEEDCRMDELEDNSDEDEDDNDDDIEGEVEEEVKPQQQKNKNKQAQYQQEQKKKEEGKKLANGKEAKLEQQTKQQKKNKDQQHQKSAQNCSPPEQKKITEEGGVVVEDFKVGNGAFAKAGKFVGVYYVGRLKNGRKFDAVMQGDGFKFRLGKGEVIKGWDVGINGMRVGGKRRITIPAPMAYGTKGSPPTIPPNSTLTFDVELRNVY